MKTSIIFFLIAALFLNCGSDDDQSMDSPDETMYFPPNGSETWETTSFSELDWNESEMPALLAFLEEKNTKGFMILVNGRIVMENYFDGHT